MRITWRYLEHELDLLESYSACHQNSFLQFSHAKFLHTDGKTNELTVERNFEKDSQALRPVYKPQFRKRKNTGALFAWINAEV